MTNEEKINRLRDIQRCTPIHTRDGIRDFEALEGGIEALEALSKIQLQQIEKKDYPFEGLEKYDLFKMDNLVVVPLYQVIDHLSQPQGEWIPVSERMPDKFDRYLISTDEGRVEMVGYGYTDDLPNEIAFHEWDDEEWQCWKPNVTAWMPRPKAYKAESEADT